MKTGKLPWFVMEELLSLLPIKDLDVVIGPSQGEDAAVIRVRDGFLVVHSDPITTGARRAGYLAVHVAANDIAVRGVEPRWFLPVILLPSKYSENDVRELFQDMSRALREINGVVVGGHTEVTPGIDRPIITMTTMGYTSTRVILTRDARPGDYLYVIGRVGGEGAGILAWDFQEKLLEKKVNLETIEKAKNYIFEISVVKTALGIKDYVSAMHDATEGGVLQAVRELAVASGSRAIIDIDKIRIEKTVSEITSAMGVNPLKLLSSGCIVASVPASRREKLEEKLNKLGVQYSCIGVLEKGSGEVVLKSRGEIIEVVDKDIIDEIYKLW